MEKQGAAGHETVAVNLDAYAPAEMARRVEAGGVYKARLGAWETLALSVLAGSFIAMGAQFYTVTITQAGLGFGITRLIGGLTFSLGLILVVVAGAELFTGNNLIVMAWASRRVTTGMLLRNWTIVYLGNLAGSLATLAMVLLSGQWALGGGAVGAQAVQIATAKVGLSFWGAFWRGVLCNALVCLAVWLCFSARTVTDKVLAIVFPITAFVASGFEHSIANMYFIPLGMALRENVAVLAAARLSAADVAGLDLAGFLSNLVPVTLGNVVGGGVLVAAVYWSVYLWRNPGVTG